MRGDRDIAASFRNRRRGHGPRIEHDGACVGNHGGIALANMPADLQPPSREDARRHGIVRREANLRATELDQGQRQQEVVIRA